MLPTLAQLLTLSLDELIGTPLPKTKQQFVSQMLDTVLAQQARPSV